MNFRIVEQDIRGVPVQGTVIAHCIAADLGWGSGIAPVIIREMFDAEMRCRYKCSNNPDGVPSSVNLAPGDLHVVDAKDGWLVNLITKEHSWDKPTYSTLTSTLFRLKNWLLGSDVPHRIVMPKIGCGLDRLDWNVVICIIKGMFYDTDFDITIVYK